MGWFSHFRKRLEQSRIEKYEEQFQQYFTETLEINELDTVHMNLIKRLHVALHPEYMEKVNSAFRMKFPRYSQQQVNELWRELKRYFVLAAVFKHVDMFNDKVDELWHIMLKHENDYNQFCKSFIGQKIQHIPHKQPTFKPTERTLFDFYYVHLFTLDSISMKVWKKFFKEDKGRIFVDEFTSNELEQLKLSYMRPSTSAEAESTFDAFTSKIKQSIPNESLNWKKAYDHTENASFAYMAYVWSDDNSDDKDFKDLFGDNSNHSTTSLHAHHHNDHHHTDSGSGSDTSSCSSCSSCSSS